MLDLSLCDVCDVLLNRRGLRAELSAAGGLKECRVAILGGSTTNELTNFIELLMLAAGFRPTFYQSEFGRYYEDAVQDSHDLIAFKPDLVYVHISCLNVVNKPHPGSSEGELAEYVAAELDRYLQIWNAIESNIGCQLIQNNFETPPHAMLGNLDAVSSDGFTRFLMQLNLAMAAEAAKRPRVLLQDIHSLSAQVGLSCWFDWKRYWSYKLLLTSEANLELARSFTSLLRALYGMSRKVLVLDLDNTLWGGVIGDDGVERIQIGRETPVAESYTAFQEYCLALRNRGVLLAVCSKNNEATAKAGFEHPSSVLKLEHFSAFRANWEPKHENILSISTELNLGVDSFVFIDDNPAERAIVQGQLPQVAVPNVGAEVSQFADFIQRARYFEPVSMSQEDLARAGLYADNSRRAALQQTFANYGEYLLSLNMTAEINTFTPLYMDRIAQLTNKTNQFNLTTRRYTLAEMEAVAHDRSFIGLYGKLQDRFGDNGLISIVLGRCDGEFLYMDLWLMSCRVLKRDMELAMLDALAERAITVGITAIVGIYLPTVKNAMVADFYSKLGFEPYVEAQAGLPPETTAWKLNLSHYTRRNHCIQVKEFSYA